MKTSQESNGNHIGHKDTHLMQCHNGHKSWFEYTVLLKSM